MKRITIDYGDYCDETNDYREAKLAKVEGPRYRDEEGFFRVPRSGYVRNGVEYWLRGFGKLDRKPGPKIEIPLEAVKWFENRLGAGYVPHFIRNRELRVRVSTAIGLIGWDAFRKRVERAATEMPILKAIDAAASAPAPQPESSRDVYDLPPAGGIEVTPDELEDMFK